MTASTATRAGLFLHVVVLSGLLDAFEATLSLTCRHAPVLEQLVLCDFIREGHFGRHLRRMREVYAERLSILLEVPDGSVAGSTLKPRPLPQPSAMYM
jgi:GntR family transcriptional regulator/MocR family aminotransferase